MDPAPAFSARGRRGGRVHRRKLYYEAFDELTRWARREFQLGRKLRTCVGAPSWRGRPISLKRAIGTCGTSTPTSTTPSSPEAATPKNPFCKICNIAKNTSMRARKPGGRSDDLLDAPTRETLRSSVPCLGLFSAQCSAYRRCPCINQEG